MSVSRFSPIEQIAHDVADACEGWEFLWNPDNGGRRARLVRKHSDTLHVEIEIHQESTGYFVFVGAHVRGRDHSWQTVSASVRNPMNRRAIEEVNRRLDELEAAASKPSEDA